jgi:ribosomal protein S6--L-glutamate ligase
MRLVLLSRSSTIYSTRRLLEAARERRISVRVLDPRELELHLDGREAHVFRRGKPVGAVDAVIPRIAPSVGEHGLAVLSHLGLAGAVTVNSARAIAESRNRMGCLQLLAASGIAVPATAVATDAAQLKAMIPLVGGLPVLLKVQGAAKQGVAICESPTSLEASLEAILGLGQTVLVQRYVRRRGRDIRALVVGREMLCAVRRIPRPGHLYRTLGRGATFERVELPHAYERAAIDAARRVGLEVAAVDLLDDEGGPKVFEVNSSPSLKELEEASGLDLAGAIVEHARLLVHRARAARLSRPPLPEPPPFEVLPGAKGLPLAKKARKAAAGKVARGPKAEGRRSRRAAGSGSRRAGAGSRS